MRSQTEPLSTNECLSRSQLDDVMNRYLTDYVWVWSVAYSSKYFSKAVLWLLIQNPPRAKSVDVPYSTGMDVFLRYTSLHVAKSAVVGGNGVQSYVLHCTSKAKSRRIKKTKSARRETPPNSDCVALRSYGTSNTDSAVYPFFPQH